MKLTPLAHETAWYVVNRAHDLEEIYTLVGYRNPWLLTNAAMAYANFGWCAWAGEIPVAIFGAAPAHAGVWNVFLMTTGMFPAVALGLTRFARREVVPRLWDMGAHRLQCDLHEKHEAIHRWVEGFGAVKESVMERYAPDGASYYRFALLKPVDRQT